MIVLKREKVERNWQRKREKERHTHPIASGGGEDVVEAGVNKVEADGVQGAFPFLQAVGDLILSSLLSRHQISHHRLRPDTSCPRGRCLRRSRCLERHRHSLLLQLLKLQLSLYSTKFFPDNFLHQTSLDKKKIIKLFSCPHRPSRHASPRLRVHPAIASSGPVVSHSFPSAHEGILYSYCTWVYTVFVMYMKVCGIRIISPSREGDSWHSSRTIHPRYCGWSGSNKRSPPMGLRADSFKCDVTRLIRGLWLYFWNQIVLK